jgi:integrase
VPALIKPVCKKIALGSGEGIGGFVDLGEAPTALFGSEATLFHAGVIDMPPRKAHPNRAATRAAVPPRLAATLLGYVEQLRLSLRPGTIVGGLRRRHIESYKLHLVVRSSVRGDRLSKTAFAEHVGALRTCFERLPEWDGDDVPTGVLVFAGDLPRRDEPLPRFLDDGRLVKLLQAARADPDPFTLLAIEFLARTGLRKGEFLDLTVDAVVQIGSAYWLHVPVGKLCTDRYIPLHPQLKEMLDDWLGKRPAGLRSDYLFLERGRRITKNRVDRALAAAATAAGIGHVTPQ